MATNSRRSLAQRERRLCPYVFLTGDATGDARASTRSALPEQDRLWLLQEEIVGDVDPCVRPRGHPGEHVLGTMYYDPKMENPVHS